MCVLGLKDSVVVLGEIREGNSYVDVRLKHQAIYVIYIVSCSLAVHLHIDGYLWFVYVFQVQVSSW